MEVTIEREGSVLVARPDGRLETLASRTFREALEGAIKPDDEAVILDFESLSYISSAGLRAVVILRDQFRVAGIRLVICSPSAPVRSVFETSGFDRVVRVADTLDDARAAVSDPA